MVELVAEHVLAVTRRNIFVIFSLRSEHSGGVNPVAILHPDCHITWHIGHFQPQPPSDVAPEVNEPSAVICRYAYRLQGVYYPVVLCHLRRSRLVGYTHHMSLCPMSAAIVKDAGIDALPSELQCLPCAKVMISAWSALP